MRMKWAKIVVVPILVLLPFLILWTYQRQSKLPTEIVIGTGPPGGQFHPLMESLKEEIEEKLHITARLTTPDTNGAVDNRLLLQAGKVDFGLYLAGALEIMEQLDPKTLEVIRSHLPPGNEQIAFVANLYLAPVHRSEERRVGKECRL